jgi:hypothetical protein
MRRMPVLAQSQTAQRQTSCGQPSGPSSILGANGTVSLGGLGALVGGILGPGQATVGYVIASQFGVGGNVNYVPSTNSLYVGPIAVFSPLQPTGGSGISFSYTPIPAGQSANSIANGTSSSVGFQASPFFGSVVTDSPGSGPPVVGYQIGTRSQVPVFGISHNYCIVGNCGC